MQGNVKNSLFLHIKERYNIKLETYNDFLYFGMTKNRKMYYLPVLRKEVITGDYLNNIINVLKDEEALLYPLTFVTNKEIDESAMYFISLFNGELDILKI